MGRYDYFRSMFMQHRTRWRKPWGLNSFHATINFLERNTVSNRCAYSIVVQLSTIFVGSIEGSRGVHCSEVVEILVGRKSYDCRPQMGQANNSLPTLASETSLRPRVKTFKSTVLPYRHDCSGHCD